MGLGRTAKHTQGWIHYSGIVRNVATHCGGQTTPAPFATVPGRWVANQG
jgi:hypothetical protein